jgi:hypothetical protein
MTQGERDTAVGAARLVQRQQLRIRTVAVSFAAAVASARHDLDLGRAELDALVEVWRTWSLEQLHEYAAELDALARDRPELHDHVGRLRSELTDAIDAVRRA